MTEMKNENYNIKQYLQEIVKEPLKIFRELTSWSETDKQEFSVLLIRILKQQRKRETVWKNWFLFLYENLISLRCIRMYIQEQMKLMK